MTTTELVTLNDNNVPTTTSLIVAESFGKQHKDVLKAINNIIETFDIQGIGDKRNFAPISYWDSMNREKPCYEMDRKAFMILVMGFTGDKALKFKNDFVDAFNAMEEQIKRKQEPLQIEQQEIVLLAQTVLDQNNRTWNLQQHYYQSK